MPELRFTVPSPPPSRIQFRSVSPARHGVRGRRCPTSGLQNCCFCTCPHLPHVLMRLTKSPVCSGVKSTVAIATCSHRILRLPGYFDRVFKA